MCSIWILIGAMTRQKVKISQLMITWSLAVGIFLKYNNTHGVPFKQVNTYFSQSKTVLTILNKVSARKSIFPFFQHLNLNVLKDIHRNISRQNKSETFSIPTRHSFRFEAFIWTQSVIQLEWRHKKAIIFPLKFKEHKKVPTRKVFWRKSRRSNQSYCRDLWNCDRERMKYEIGPEIVPLSAATALRETYLRLSESLTCFVEWVKCFSPRTPIKLSVFFVVDHS